MDQEEVIDLIAAEFNLGLGIPPASLLVDDLGLDSLQMIELVAFIEEKAGLSTGTAPNDYPILETIEDAAKYFDELVGRGSS